MGTRGILPFMGLNRTSSSESMLSDAEEGIEDDVDDEEHVAPASQAVEGAGTRLSRMLKNLW